MTLEIAQRLTEMRKARGCSQEELALHLGVSRQAVSKWERAEASPDTDNLIALARFYGVTLDELILGGKPRGMMDIPQTTGPQPAKHTPATAELPETEHVSPTVPATASLQDVSPTVPASSFTEDASPTMPVTGFAEDASPTMPPETRQDMDSDDPLPHGSYYDMKRREEEKAREDRRRSFPYPVLATILYLLMGFLLGWWHPGWVIFLTIPLYYLPERERSYRRLLGNPIMLTIIYILMGSFLGWWHPGWLIYLLIPIMHMK